MDNTLNFFADVIHPRSLHIKLQVWYVKHGSGHTGLSCHGNGK